MKRSSFEQAQFCIRPICAAVLFAAAIQGAQANPVGASVVNGQASFATSGNTLTVTNTPGAIINWQGFSIGANEITRFAQQSAASTVLNRVVSSNPSNILGSLQSNGRVFLVNPNGIIFGAGATVDVAGLVATTLNFSNEDFLAGHHRYTEVPGAQKISNAGNLTAQGGGQIYLIAPDVENTGIITAPNGGILLAAGHSVELVDTANPNLRVNITAPAGDATNVGQLVAEAGSLGLFGTVVKNSGTVNADSATMQGGKIVFKASQRTEISGTVSANSTATPLSSAEEGQGRGGIIEVLGDQVGLMDGASISADGTQGGGTVLIGGDYQGKNPDVPNADITYVAQTASISADATDSGNGGKVIVWADGTTRAYGNISARGGVNGGNGGFVETSGKNYLDVGTIQVDRSAPKGQAGTWLLDPTNVTIDLAGAAGDGAFNAYSPGLVFEGATTNPTILWSTITSNLASGPVMITTTSGTSGVGNMFFAGGKTYGYSSANDLWLVAQQGITGNGITLSNSGSGALRFIAGWNGTFPASRFDYSGYNVTSGTGTIGFLGSNISTAGSIYARAGSDITVKVAYPTGGTSASLVAGGTMDIETYGNLIVANEPIATNNGTVIVKSTGNQTIALKGATSSLIVSASAGGFGGMAQLSADGSQTIDFTASGTHAITLTGGSGANTSAGANATIEAAGTQQILNSGAGTLAISLTGGDVTNNTQSSTKDGVTICTSCATYNTASIRSTGAQTINATTITLQGGSGGNSNRAEIESKSSQSITTTGAISLTGGSSGGLYVSAYNETVGNEADIHADGAQTISAASITLAGGAGASTLGGAFLSGKTSQSITTTGGLTMTGGASTASGMYGLGAPAVIGEENGANITLNIGGALGMTGGSGSTSGALIGSAQGTPSVAITAGSISMSAGGSKSQIGVLTGGPAGSLTMTAPGGISQSGASYINTNTLSASASGAAINLAGANLVNTVTSLSAYSNVSYTSAQAVSVSSAISTMGGTVTLTSSAGDISVGTVSTSGNATVNAYGAIYETNGVGVTDITANSVSLTSGHDGTSGGLAISADVSLTGGTPTISASVASTSTYGGIRINNTGSLEPSSATLTDASTTAGYGWVDYLTGNNVNTSTSTYNLSSQNGGVELYSSGTVTLTNLATFLPGQANSYYKFTDIWGGTGLTVSNPGNTAADLFLGSGGAMSIAGNLSANNLGLYAADSITATAATIGATYDLGMWSDSGITLANSSVAASNGSAYLGSAALVLVFDATGGESYSSGGSIALDNSHIDAGYNVYSYTGGDIRLNNGSDVEAVNDVHLVFGGSSSTLYLNDTAGQASDSYILANMPMTTYVDFLARSSGGVVIDGVETTATAAGGSGFFSGSLSTPAVLGSELMVTYHIASTTVNSIVNEVVVIPPDIASGDTIITETATTTETAATTEEEKKEEEAVVVANGSTPVAEDTSTASLPVCK